MLKCFNQCNSNACSPGASDRIGLKIIDETYQSLSAEEKERVHQDLYGVAQPIEETPDFVKAKLEELDRELEDLNDTIKKAYVLAKSLEDRATEEYVSCRKFRLMFLRVEEFDARKASLRLVRYLQDKLDMFGVEVLPRKIKAEDLTEQDIETLTSGYCCVTKEADKSGRLLLFVRRSIYFEQDVTCMIRCLYYLLQIALENNEDAQKRGLVTISFNVGEQRGQWKSQIRKIMPLYRHGSHALPIRFAAYHFFYNDLRDTFLLNLIAVVFTKRTRSRVHRHYVTSHEQSLFILLSLGINPNALPYTEEGTFRKEIMYEHLSRHSSITHFPKTKEQSNNQDPILSR